MNQLMRLQVTLCDESFFATIIAAHVRPFTRLVIIMLYNNLHEFEYES